MPTDIDRMKHSTAARGAAAYSGAPMTTHDVAARVLQSVGGRENLLTNNLCMTRLRLTVLDPKKVDRDKLGNISGVLGTVSRGANGIEVIFGPGGVRTIYESLCEIIGQNPDDGGETAVGTQTRAKGIKVRILGPNDRADFRHHIQFDETSSAKAESPAGSGKATARPTNELSSLLGLAEEEQGADEAPMSVSRFEDSEKGAQKPQQAKAKVGPRLLVINGPNINMLGIREPGIYGREDFAHLVALCKKVAEEAGFSKCTCFQSNHEGDLVDAIQEAYGNYDGIVINPAAYTHTSVAILDALKAVSIPAIEVHISKVSEREDFRQVSYVRAACFETITGMGIRGYAKAIHDMASYLSK